MTRRSAVWVVVGVVSLLVVGCASRGGAATSDIVTRPPASTAARMPSPTLTQADRGFALGKGGAGGEIHGGL